MDYDTIWPWIQALLNMVMNIRVPRKAGESFDQLSEYYFSCSGTLFHTNQRTETMRMRQQFGDEWTIYFYIAMY
jgi:hypothetical protein